MQFPHHTSILWDRENIESPHFIKPNDVIPCLVLTSKDIASILNCLSESSIQSQNINYTACIVPSNPQLRTQVRLQPSAQLNNQLQLSIRLVEDNMMVNNESNTFTIPIVSRKQDDNDLIFDPSATNNLIENLSKSIQFSKNFTIRSCFRIRAAGFAQKINYITRGAIRFEAILPNISFMAIRIKPIPILATPLAITLTELFMKDQPSSLDGNLSESYQSLQMGYMTMSATRKMIPLLEQDISIGQTPLIGVWVTITRSDGLTDKNLTKNWLSHPKCWSACVRYLSNGYIQNRISVAPNTFLLALMVGESILYYELTSLPLNPAEDMDPNTRQPPISRRANDFLCMDFSVDLSDEMTSLMTADDVSNDPENIVICKFKPLTRPVHIEAFKSSTPSRHHSESVAPPPPSRPTPSGQFQRRADENQSNLVKGKVEVNREGFNKDEEITPVPRSSQPIPSSSPNNPRQGMNHWTHTARNPEKSSDHPLRGSKHLPPAAMANLVNQLDRRTAPKPDDSTEFQLPVYEDTSSVRYTDKLPTAAEIVMSQQYQIDSLRNEVKELKEIILLMAAQKLGKEGVTGQGMKEVDHSNSERRTDVNRDPSEEISDGKNIEKQRNHVSSDHPTGFEHKKKDDEPRSEKDSNIVDGQGDDGHDLSFTESHQSCIDLLPVVPFTTKESMKLNEKKFFNATMNITNSVQRHSLLQISSLLKQRSSIAPTTGTATNHSEAAHPLRNSYVDSDEEEDDHENHLLFSGINMKSKKSKQSRPFKSILSIKSVNIPEEPQSTIKSDNAKVRLPSKQAMRHHLRSLEESTVLLESESIMAIQSQYLERR